MKRDSSHLEKDSNNLSQDILSPKTKRKRLNDLSSVMCMKGKLPPIVLVKDEVLCHIFSYLSTFTEIISNVMPVCSRWYNLLNSGRHTLLSNIEINEPGFACSRFSISDDKWEFLTSLIQKQQAHPHTFLYLGNQLWLPSFRRMVRTKLFSNLKRLEITRVALIEEEEEEDDEEEENSSDEDKNNSFNTSEEDNEDQSNMENQPKLNQHDQIKNSSQENSQKNDELHQAEMEQERDELVLRMIKQCLESVQLLRIPNCGNAKELLELFADSENLMELTLSCSLNANLLISNSIVFPNVITLCIDPPAGEYITGVQKIARCCPNLRSLEWYQREPTIRLEDLKEIHHYCPSLENLTVAELSPSLLQQGKQFINNLHALHLYSRCSEDDLRAIGDTCKTLSVFEDYDLLKNSANLEQWSDNYSYPDFIEQRGKTLREFYVNLTYVFPNASAAVKSITEHVPKLERFRLGHMNISSNADVDPTDGLFMHYCSNTDSSAGSEESSSDTEISRKRLLRVACDRRFTNALDKSFKVKFSDGWFDMPLYQIWNKLPHLECISFIIEDRENIIAQSTRLQFQLGLRFTRHVTANLGLLEYEQLRVCTIRYATRSSHRICVDGRAKYHIQMQQIQGGAFKFTLSKVRL